MVILHGREDSLVPFANAGFLERGLTGAIALRTIVLEGEDHFFIWSRPAVVWAALDELLARR